MSLDIKAIRERLEKVPEALNVGYDLAEKFKQCVFQIWALQNPAASDIARRYHNANCGPTNRALKEIAEQAPTDIKALLEEVERLRKVAEQAVKLSNPRGSMIAKQYSFMWPQINGNGGAAPFRFSQEEVPELAAYLKERDALSGETDGAA